MPITDTLYDEAFYDANESGSYRSARVVLGLALPVLAPVSVLDVGCGIGTWLRAASELGARDLLGIDGAYIDRARFHVDSSYFSPANLEDSVEVGTAINGRRFDLAMCLEAAEHVPAAAARGLVAAIAGAADVVLWSAAIPGQGGTFHVNERPLSYWASLWNEEDFRPVDMLRPGLQFTGIDLWYMQNAILFVRRSHAADIEAAFRGYYEARFGYVPPLAFVHYACLSKCSALPHETIATYLDDVVIRAKQALEREIGVGPEHIERVDFAWDGALVWAGLRQPDQSIIQPIILFRSPYRMSVDIGFYYPQWQAQPEETAVARARAEAAGLAWADPLGFQLDGWAAIGKGDLAFRLSISLMEGLPDESSVTEAARDIAQLWSDYYR